MKKRHHYPFSKKNHGFTLVELIVVLVILAILAAIMIPALLGYIDKAKGAKYIVEAKELVTASQAGIVEGYANDREGFLKNCTKSAYKKVGQKYDFFSSNLFATIQGNGSSGSTNAKYFISEKILEYVDSQKNSKNKTYKFYSGNLNNMKAADIPKDQQAFLLLYNQNGKILYMQYASEGYLVTYDGKSYDVEKGGQFIKFQ